MARIIFVLIGILATQNVNCAPSDTIDETLESEHDEQTLNDKPYSIFENNENVYKEKLQVQRQKRTFPSIYYMLRLQKLQEKLRNKVYLSYPPLQPSLYPVFVPDRISQVPGSRNPVSSDETITQTPESTNVYINPRSKNVPTLHDRPPEMEDERQNWGMVIDNTSTGYDDDIDDNGRHIPLIRPSPEPTNVNINPQNETVPTLHDRPPEMEDERQNWGMVINNTTTDYGNDDDDNGRHIPLIGLSTEPITVNMNPQNETVPTLHDRPPKMEDERQNWGMVINNTMTDYDDADDDNGRHIPLNRLGSSQAYINDTETPPTIKQ